MHCFRAIYTHCTCHGLWYKINQRTTLWSPLCRWRIQWSRFPQCVLRCLITKSLHQPQLQLWTVWAWTESVCVCVPTSGMKVNVYGPPRHTCLNWGASDDPRFTLVETPSFYVGRIVVCDALIVEKASRLPGNRLAYIDGEAVGYMRDGVELLGIAPTCTVSWVSYTAGAPLPNGAIVGSHLASGE